MVVVVFGLFWRGGELAKTRMWFEWHRVYFADQKLIRIQLNAARRFSAKTQYFLIMWPLPPPSPPFSIKIFGGDHLLHELWCVNLTRSSWCVRRNHAMEFTRINNMDGRSQERRTHASTIILLFYSSCSTVQHTRTRWLSLMALEQPKNYPLELFSVHIESIHCWSCALIFF